MFSTQTTLVTRASFSLDMIAARGFTLNPATGRQFETFFSSTMRLHLRQWNILLKILLVLEGEFPLRRLILGLFARSGNLHLG